MNLKHYASIHSDYDFLGVENEGKAVETWTYLVHLDKEMNKSLEIEFTIQHEPEHRMDLVRATTITYGEKIEPCPICGTRKMEISPEYEAEKDIHVLEKAFTHECGFTEEEVMDLAVEIYIDDNFGDIMTQEHFNNDFVIEGKKNKRIYLQELNSGNRYIVKNNKVYHFQEHGETAEECPFCESKELIMYDEEGIWMKCSVLSKNIYDFKKLIKNSNRQPIE